MLKIQIQIKTPGTRTQNYLHLQNILVRKRFVRSGELILYALALCPWYVIFSLPLSLGLNYNNNNNNNKKRKKCGAALMR